MTTISAQPNNYSNVPASHGQGGYGMGAPGSSGGNPQALGGTPWTPGGYMWWARQRIGPSNLHTDADGKTWYVPSYNNMRVPNRNGGGFESRKGTAWDVLPQRYLDDPHQSTW